jgi:hypothetical protein
MEQIEADLLDIVRLDYIISVILFSYLAIRYTRFSKSSPGQKKLLTLGIGVALSLFYYTSGLIELKPLIPSFAIAVVLYDYLIKYALNYAKLDYDRKVKKKQQ